MSVTPPGVTMRLSPVQGYEGKKEYLVGYQSVTGDNTGGDIVVQFVEPSSGARQRGVRLKSIRIENSDSTSRNIYLEVLGKVRNESGGSFERYCCRILNSGTGNPCLDADGKAPFSDFPLPWMYPGGEYGDPTFVLQMTTPNIDGKVTTLWICCECTRLPVGTPNVWV